MTMWGPGLILMHPKGGMLRKILEDWIKDENIKRGYDMVYSPHIARLHLFEISGHAGFYSESMFSPHGSWTGTNTRLNP